MNDIDKMINNMKKVSKEKSSMLKKRNKRKLLIKDKKRLVIMKIDDE